MISRKGIVSGFCVVAVPERLPWFEQESRFVILDVYATKGGGGRLVESIENRRSSVVMVNGSWCGMDRCRGVACNGDAALTTGFAGHSNLKL